MNGLPGFFAPSAAWLFLLLIPLIAFYFLKLRRPRVTVPSLVLWQQVLNDQRVNSPFQRFKKNLLLLLQILLLILLVLAAMQPFLLGKSARSERIPILIDTSASMAAIDVPGGQSRLQLAQERIAEVIQNMLPDQEMCLISISNSARQETGFTGDKRLLTEALNELQIHDVTSNLEDGLRMAQAIRRSAPFERLTLYSDGNFPEQAFLDLQFDIDFRKLDTGGPNIGITECSARRADSESWDLFVELRNSSDSPSNATLTITSDEVILASKIVSVLPESPRRFIFRIDGRNAALLQVQLAADSFDSLAADNVAYLRLEQNRPLNVFAPTGMYAARHALRTQPDTRVFPTADPLETGPERFDLVISNRTEDAAISAPLKCIFASLPADLANLISVKEEPGEIIDWKRDSPLFEHVNLRDILLLDSAIASPDANSTTLGELGYRVLVEGNSGPLMLEKESSSDRIIHVLFDPDRSTMPTRVAFPIFIANLVNEALAGSGLAETRANATGVLPPVRLAPDSTATVIAPDGKQSTFTADDEGILTGIIARKTGSYRILPAGEAEEQQVGASLVSSTESTLTSVDRIEFNELAITANADGDQGQDTDKPVWRYIAIAALLLLIAEWWFFQKRPYAIRKERAKVAG